MATDMAYETNAPLQDPGRMIGFHGLGFSQRKYDALNEDESRRTHRQDGLVPVAEGLWLNLADPEMPAAVPATAADRRPGEVHE